MGETPEHEASPCDDYYAWACMCLLLAFPLLDKELRDTAGPESKPNIHVLESFWSELRARSHDVRCLLDAAQEGDTAALPDLLKAVMLR